MKERLRALGQLWQRVPASLRKTIVFTIGGTLVLLGIALVVLPGPFTVPLLIAGFAVLGTEFAWASRALERAKQGIDLNSSVRGSETPRVVVWTGGANRV